jgi:hypothetical protein
MVTTRFGLRSLLVLLALVLSCSGRDQTPAGEPSTRPSTPAGGASRGAAEAAADLDLQAMLSPVPEYEGVGRNLFAFGAARRPASATERVEPPPEPTPRPVVTVPPRAPRPGSPTTARLDMKYAGFLEKTGPDGSKAKYAIFLDGNEILAGTEGETIANRFTVVEIGLESVTVSPTGSTATQRIPLQSK